MFIFTTKLNRKKLILIVLAVALILCAIILMSPTRLLSTGGQSDKAMAEQAMSKKAGSDEDRVAFLKSFGWKLEEEPIEMCEVAIPKEFDEVYNAYNKIQKDQGFDLKKFKGKTAMMYTYRILNHPSAEEEVRANVLVYKEKVIGGDVCSLNIDGFMHGFEMPPSESASVSDTAQIETEEDASTAPEETQPEQGKEEIPDGIFIEE